MKFAETIQEQLVPEWKEKYINYKKGKKLIKAVKAASAAQSPGTWTPSTPTGLQYGSRQAGSSGEYFTLPEASMPLGPGVGSTNGPGHGSGQGASVAVQDAEATPLMDSASVTYGTAIFRRLTNTGGATEDDFMDWINGELVKVNEFFTQKETLAKERFEILQDQMYHLRLDKIKRKRSPLANSSSADPRGKEHGVLHKELLRLSIDLPSLPHRSSDFVHKERTVPYFTAKRQIKAAVMEFYRGVELLKSYRLLNQTGFRKMIKKYDKANKTHHLEEFMFRVKNSHFVTSDVLDNLSQKMELVYADNFTHGNKKTAVEILRSKDKPDEHYLAMFASGILLGMAIPLLAYSMYSGIHDTLTHSLPEGKFLLQIWGGFLSVILMGVLFGLNCAIWSAYKVNYKFIFEFNPKTALHFREYSFFVNLYLFLVAIFSAACFHWTGSSMLKMPWIFMILAACLMINPMNSLYKESRTWMTTTLWRLLFSGLYPVEFRDFFVGDIVCSLTYAVGNISFFACLYATNWRGAGDETSRCGSSHSRAMGFFSALPSIWRLLQCIRRYLDSGEWFPHLANMTKYLVGVVYYATLSVYRINKTGDTRAVFIFFAVINSCYCSFWDVFMDWSLMSSDKNRYLRDELVFPKWWYYSAIGTDIILRFQWIFYALFPRHIQQSAVTSFSIAIAEVIRRFIWMIFRMENEHCTNIHLYRASRDAPLPYPVDDHEIHELQPMADEEQHLPGAPIRRHTVFQMVSKIIGQAHRKDFERKKQTKPQRDHDSSDEESEDDEAQSLH